MLTEQLRFVAHERGAWIEELWCASCDVRVLVNVVHGNRSSPKGVYLLGRGSEKWAVLQKIGVYSSLGSTMSSLSLLRRPQVLNELTVVDIDDISLSGTKEVHHEVDAVDKSEQLHACLHVLDSTGSV